MLKRNVVIAASVALAAFGATIADAKSIHRLKSTAEFALISTSGGFPGVGGKALFAGVIKARPGGNGAAIARFTVTRRPSSTTGVANGTNVSFFADGSATVSVIVTLTTHGDGSSSITGSGRFTGGTGIYRGITGKVKLTASIPAGSHVAAVHLTGTALY